MYPLYPDRNEYIDKYLFPFEKENNLDTMRSYEYFFELKLNLYKFTHDESYISSLEIPKNIKYCIINLDEYYHPDARYRYDHVFRANYYPMPTVYTQIETFLDTVLQHDQIEYLYCSFQLKNIEKYTNLKTLGLQFDEYYYSLDTLPASLIRLEIDSANLKLELNNLPPNLKVLRIHTDIIGKNLCDGYHHSLNYLPSGLEVLYLPENSVDPDDDFQITIANLPSGIKYLYIPTLMSNHIDLNCIPDSVEVIHFPNYHNCISRFNKYPTSLQELYTENDCEDYPHESDSESQIRKQTSIANIKKHIEETKYLGCFDIYMDDELII